MQGSTVMRQRSAETLVPEELYELIAHIRDCGGPVGQPPDLPGSGRGGPRRSGWPLGAKNLSTSQFSTALIPEWDQRIISRVRVIAKRTLRQFWESAPQYADAKGPLEAWYAEARKAQWRTPQDIKAQFRHAS